MPLNYVAGCFGADRSDYMKDREWQKGFSLLAKHNLHFEMQIFDSQIPDAAQVARLFPETPIVLEHLGWPLKPNLDNLPAWKNRLAELAECPNVFLKLSCLGWIFQKLDEATILPYLCAAITLFGVDRCMVGSNCPPDTLYLSFDEIFHLFRKAMASYPETEQQKIFYGNAKKFYRL